MNRTYCTSQSTSYPLVYASTSPLVSVLAQAKKIAQSTLPVLITGPTGSGKENLARYLHEESIAKNHPFVDLNCSAIPAELFESELFGHQKGAFTGAHTDRKGLMELTESGTLFLDEVGELPYRLQAKLLRALETKTFRAVGGTALHHFKGRIIAATHKNLSSMVNDKLFREDLYYRLAVFSLEIPGLHKRKDDIVPLIEHFSKKLACNLTLTEAAIARLQHYAWPGNVRELRNLIERLSILSNNSHVTETVLDSFLPNAFFPEAEQAINSLIDIIFSRSPQQNKLDYIEYLLITNALSKCDGNKTEAAAILGVHRKVIERRITKLNSYTKDIRKCISGAQTAMQRAEYKSAVSILENCISPDGTTKIKINDEPLLCKIYFLYGLCCQRTFGWMNETALNFYNKAITIAKKIGDTPTIHTTRFLVWISYLKALNLIKARSAANELLYYAKTVDNQLSKREGYIATANTLFWLGDCQEAISALQESELLSQEHEDFESLHQIDMYSLGVMFYGLCSFQLGKFKETREAFAQLLCRDMATQNTAKDRCFILQGIAWIGFLLEEWEIMEAAAVELKNYSQNQHCSFYIGIGRMFYGQKLFMEGNTTEALKEMTEGYQNFIQSEGGLLFQSVQAWLRGEVLLAQDNPEECFHIVSAAIATSIEHQERAYLAELMELQARAHALIKDEYASQISFERVISTAQVIGTIPARIKAAAQLALLFNSNISSDYLTILGLDLSSLDIANAPPTLKKAISLILSKVLKDQTDSAHFT